MAAHLGDPCIYCHTKHDEVPLGPCMGHREHPVNYPNLIWDIRGTAPDGRRAFLDSVEKYAHAVRVAKGYVEFGWKDFEYNQVCRGNHRRGMEPSLMSDYWPPRKMNAPPPAANDKLPAA